VAYAVSWTRPERVPGVRLTNGASTWPCRQRKVHGARARSSSRARSSITRVPRRNNATRLLSDGSLRYSSAYVADPRAQGRQLMQQPAFVLARLDGVLL